MQKVGRGWFEAARILTTSHTRFTRAWKMALLKEAHFLRGRMVKGFASGSPGGATFAPLSPLTIALRKFRGFGGTKPMNVTGGLRKAISVVHERGGSGPGGKIFVGVHHTARRTGAPGGKGALDIAEIHEFGRTWTQPFTSKSRRFLFMVMAKYGGDAFKGPVERDKKGRFRRGRIVRPKSTSGKTLTIHIPPRPFIAPVLRTHAQPEAVRKRFAFHVANAMGGDFGKPE